MLGARLFNRFSLKREEKRFSLQLMQFYFNEAGLNAGKGREVTFEASATHDKETIKKRILLFILQS